MIRRLLSRLLGPAPLPPVERVEVRPALPPTRHHLARVFCPCGRGRWEALHIVALDGEELNVMALHVGASACAVVDIAHHKGLAVRHGLLYLPCGAARRFELHEWIDESAPLPALPLGVLPATQDPA